MPVGPISHQIGSDRIHVALQVAIKYSRLPMEKTPNLIVWHYEKLGVFTVKSAYRLAMTRSQNLEAEGSTSAPRGERAVWKKLWNMPVLSKICNFLWR